METLPALQGHASLFLYPFFINDALPSLSEKIAASPLWKKREVSPASSEVLYFPSEAAPILFDNTYILYEPQAFGLTSAGHSLLLHGGRLHLWGRDMGCLVLDLSLANQIEGTASPAGFTDLLDFNESFRYISDLYEGHREQRARLQVFRDGRETLSAGRVEEFVVHLLETDCLTPAFDQRLVVFSFARVEEDPPPEWVYKFFNVDSSVYELPDKKYVKHFLKHNLYRRWQGTGTLYGFTHYSGGCLVASRQPSSTEFSQDWLLGQFRTIYLDLALILLCQLSTLRRLNSRLTTLDLTNRAGFVAILADFTRFVRDHWLLRVSNQDQGRELFRLWRTIWEEDYRLMETVEHKIHMLKQWFREEGG